MITKIKNDEGEECFAIVLRHHESYEEIACMQNAIIGILQVASGNKDLFDSYTEDVYWLLELLKTTMPNDSQTTAYQKAVFAD